MVLERALLPPQFTPALSRAARPSRASPRPRPLCPARALASSSTAHIRMAALAQRRRYSTSTKGKEPDRGHDDHPGEDAHSHSHSRDHGHSHSSVFGAIAHTHTPGEDTGSAEQIVKALKSGGDPGSRITLIGLAANVGLVASKGLAGWYMNSAALLADAAHAMSDLLGDLVTLLCWRLSRRPPSALYPYGFGKFEVLGTAAVSLLLTGGALGIGLHSYTLLADALAHALPSLQPGALHDLAAALASSADALPSFGHDHGHGHTHGALDPNAAWFAAASIAVKEWLFRATTRVARAEGSPVLAANAIHHRADAYSSAVALVAILGSAAFPHLPLDPIGGLLVSALILQQSWGVSVDAFRQLTDASVPPRIHAALASALAPLPRPSARAASPEEAAAAAENPLLAVKDLRAMRAGALIFVDVTAEVPRALSVGAASALEGRIWGALKGARKEVSEVRVKFEPVHERQGEDAGAPGREHTHGNDAAHRH